MKKLFYTLLVMPLLAGMASAQTPLQFPIPDGHFEKWTTKTETPGGVEVTYDVIDEPFWSSLNMIAGLPPEMFTGPKTMFKDAGRSGKEGDFAPRMRSDRMKFGTGDKEREIFLPGVVGCIDVIVDDQSANFGRAFPCRPKSLKGYMKYHPVNKDSASIFVEVYKWDETLNRRLLLGKVKETYYDSVKDWQEFNLEVSYNEALEDVTPDSICVLFVASAGYNFDSLFDCKGQVGSTLWVDDVEFVYDGETTDPVANEKCALAAASLKPNPSASGIFKVNVAEPCMVEVLNMAGMRMQSRMLYAGENTLNLSAAPQGVYMVRLSNQKGTVVLKAVRP